MELNKNHRESLLNALEKAKEELELKIIVINRKDSDHSKEWTEISMFLVQERIKTIEKSLIDNEIDF